MDTTMTEPASPAPPPPPMPPRPGRRLTRSRNDRVIGGVAGGIAHTYGWDPGLTRVIVAVAAVVTGGAIAVAYGIAWLVIPEESTGLTGADTLGVHRARRAREHWALPVGVVLVAAGMLGIAHRFAWSPFSNLFWPITLIAGGLAVLLVRHREPPHPEGIDGPEGGGDGPEATGPDGPGDADAVREPALALAGPPAVDAVTTAEQPTIGAYPVHGPWPTGDPVPPEAPPRAPRRQRERSMLGRLTWSALLLLAGGAWLLDTTGAIEVDAGFVLTLCLVLVGVALVVGAWIGRSRGLIALAIVLVAICSVDAALDVPLTGGIGERIYRPQTASAVQQNYSLAIGHLVVDLRAVTTADGTLHVSARNAMGQLEIFVPNDAEVDIRTRVGAGDVEMFGQPDNNGWRVDQRFHAAGTGPHFVIDARVGFGQIVVKQGAPA
jgi:phage shock protein PspC (stress-responsive transcriptional regulator)